MTAADKMNIASNSKEFKTELISWKGYDWYPAEYYGQYNLEKLFCYYDPTAVHITDDDHLILQTKYNPKYFSEIDSLIRYGIGLVTCTERFSYGFFEITCKLPTGSNLWPAFWLYAWDTYPPEIDVFEGYTNEKGNYFNLFTKSTWNPFKPWKVQTNTHYDFNPNIKHIGAKNHSFNLFKPPNRYYTKYSLLWTPDIIEIKYNGRIVRRIEDKSILKFFRDIKMRVIINNHLQHDTEDLLSTSSFIIKDFKYIPL